MHIENNSSGYAKGRIAYGGTSDEPDTTGINMRATARSILSSTEAAHQAEGQQEHIVQERLR